MPNNRTRRGKMSSIDISAVAPPGCRVPKPGTPNGSRTAPATGRECRSRIASRTVLGSAESPCEKCAKTRRQRHPR